MVLRRHFGTQCLILVNTSMLRLSFFSKFAKMFQGRSSCSMTPKCQTCEDSSILFLGLNITISVLLVLSDSLFAPIQSTVSFKTLLICLLIFLSDLSMRKRLVSSAVMKRTKFDSFVQVINK